MKTGLIGFIINSEFRQNFVAFFIALTATYSIAYTSLQYVNSDNFGGNSDILVYMAIARGEDVKSEVHRESRALTISIVKLLPDPPGFIFSPGRQVDDEWILKFKFALTNSFFVFGTAFFMWLYSCRIGFSSLESYLVMLLFLTSWTVIYQGVIPLVDPSAFFFIAAGVFAIAVRKIWLFAGVLAIGIFAKESVGIIVPFALITVTQHRILWSVVSILVVLPYILWMFLLGENEFVNLGHLDPSHIQNSIKIIPEYLRLNIAIEVMATFGILWLFAFYALVTGKLSNEMRRQYIWVLAIFGMAMVLGTGLGRTLFLTFPVIIPSSVIGIRYLIGKELSLNAKS